MKVKRLKINNILSIESAEIKFDDCGMLLISGHNYDSDRSNGSGKSSVLSSLVFGVYGEYPREVTITDFVRRGSELSSVEVDIDISGIIFSVTRSRPGGFICISEGRQILEKEFLSLLSISYSQFILTAYFAQGLSDRFLSLNDSGRKDLMLNLIQANVFQAAKDKVDTDIRNNDKSIADVTSAIGKLQTKIDTYRESLRDVDTQILEKNDIEVSILSLDNELSEMDIIQKPDISKYNEAIAKLRDKIGGINSSKGEIKLLKRQLEDIRNKKEPVDNCDGTCPCCDTQLDIVGDTFVKHDSLSFENKKIAFVAKKQLQEKQLQESIDELDSRLISEDKYNDSIRALTLKIQEITHEYSESKDKQKTLLNRKLLKRQELLGIETTLSKYSIMQSKIGDAAIELENNNFNLDTLNMLSVSLKSTLSLFVSTGIPAYVLESIVDMFNQKVQNYIQSIWEQASYELLSYRESKSGNITAKLSDNLTVDGVKVAVGSLSGGELKCLSIATDLALLDIVENYTGASVSPILLDEPFDSLDSIARTKVIDLLKIVAVDRLVIVVDHASEAQTMFDKTMVVEKRDGISKIV